MPDPRPSSRALALAAAVCGTMLATLGLAATGTSTLGTCGKINVNAKQGGAKFPKGGAGTTKLTDVTITVDGCDMEIKANSIQTTSLDLDDSDWTLNGNVRIRADGTLFGERILDSSGLPAFDRAVERAVNKCGKVSPPPETMRDIVEEEGVGILFKP